MRVPPHHGLTMGVGTHVYPPVSSLPLSLPGPPVAAYGPAGLVQWVARSTTPTLIEYSS